MPEDTSLSQLIIANSSVTEFQIQYFDSEVQVYRDYLRKNGITQVLRFYQDKYYVRTYGMDIYAKVIFTIWYYLNRYVGFVGLMMNYLVVS